MKYVWHKIFLNNFSLAIVGLVLLLVIPIAIMLLNNSLNWTYSCSGHLLLIGTFFYVYINFLSELYEFYEFLQQTSGNNDRILYAISFWKIYKNTLIVVIALVILIVSFFPLDDQYSFVDLAGRLAGAYGAILVLTVVISCIGSFLSKKNN